MQLLLYLALCSTQGLVGSSACTNMNVYYVDIQQSKKSFLRRIITSLVERITIFAQHTALKVNVSSCRVPTKMIHVRPILHELFSSL